ncbi:MAG TPA: ATP-grasp domain-containing protein [Bacteroidales bacterium]|nr:ATP-grasp domain-containing protein [Bacteroidales bacterium]
MRNKTVALLYNQMSEHPKEDELDVVRQMRFISKSLRVLGYEPVSVPFSIDLEGAMKALRKIHPLVVFNLVETVEGTGGMLYFAPAILNHLGLPFTGVPLEALFITTSKVLTKKQLNQLEIPTSDWYQIDQLDQLDPKERYIVKPIWEDGSLGLDEHCVFAGNDKKFIQKLRAYNKKTFFVEHFIEGREFNLSILGGKKGPQVMPPAEILFKDYPEGKPRIVGYNAKWTENSFEYNHTPRTFRFRKEERPLLDELVRLAKKCWHDFELKGYVRVDFRVDRENRPFVLEINGNPCIAPESGYVAATKQAGLTFPQVVARILEDALN